MWKDAICKLQLANNFSWNKWYAVFQKNTCYLQTPPILALCTEMQSNQHRPVHSNVWHEWKRVKTCKPEGLKSEVKSQDMQFDKVVLGGGGGADFSSPDFSPNMHFSFICQFIISKYCQFLLNKVYLISSSSKMIFF